MSETAETYRSVTPYLIVPDAESELRFLTAAFQATEKMCERRPDNSVMHAEVTIGDSLLMIGQATEEWKALSGSFYLWVADVDDCYRKALAAGATSLAAPEDKPYGHRNAGVSDPCGIMWWLAAPVRAQA